MGPRRLNSLESRDYCQYKASNSSRSLPMSHSLVFFPPYGLSFL